MKRLLLIVWLTSILTPLPAAAQVGFVHADGARLVQGNRAFTPRGVNLGNWFVPEPYLMGGGQSNEQMRQAFQAAAGGQVEYLAWRTAWLDNYITQRDIERIKGLGFNTVRVPLDYRDFDDAGGDHDNAELRAGASLGLTYLDRLVTWCAASGVYILLDMHTTPDTINSKSGSIFVSSETEDNPNLDLVKSAWATIARRYKNVPAILGYDLLNEPRGYTDTLLRPTYAQIVAAIRAIDTTHLLVIEPNVYSDLGAPGHWFLGTPLDADMAIGPHFYGGAVPTSIDADAPNGRKYLNWDYASTYKLPIIVGEIGENNNGWTNRMVQLWNNGKDGITAGCLYWTYKKMGGAVRCIVSVPTVAGWDGIVDFLSHGGAVPANASAVMRAMAEGANSAHAVMHRDVIDSLVRDYATGRVPYPATPEAIPGVIHAADYDMGAPAPASETSHDSLYAYYDTSADGSYQVRNDGVGTRFGDGDRIIGDNNDGEWQQHTVRVSPGKYHVFLRYAAPTGGAQVSLWLNGRQILLSPVLPATGAWGTFREQPIGQVTLSTTGMTTLKIQIEHAGLDYSAVRFHTVLRETLGEFLQTRNKSATGGCRWRKPQSRS